MPAFFIIGSVTASGSNPTNFCTPVAAGEPCADPADLLVLVEVHRAGAVLLDPGVPSSGTSA